MHFSFDSCRNAFGEDPSRNPSEAFFGDFFSRFFIFGIHSVNFPEILSGFFLVLAFFQDSYREFCGGFTWDFFIDSCRNSSGYFKNLIKGHP